MIAFEIVTSTAKVAGMKVGIVSDSHGKSSRLREAMQVFIDREVDVIVHCGDIADIRDVEILGSAKPQAYLVRGNMDKHLDGLAEAAEYWGVQFHDEAVEVPLGEGEFLVAVHGHLPRLLASLIGDPLFPYICCGHTHETCDQREGITRIINPGAVYRADPPTVAILDVENDTLEFIELKD